MESEIQRGERLRGKELLVKIVVIVDYHFATVQTSRVSD